MSAQTGTAAPEGPASQRAVDRAKFRVALWQANPNPIWMRELKQAARLTRTPVILMVVTILMTLLMATVGGALTASVPPATIGVALFHTFFSLAFFVVTWVGPAVAANSIASEREGRTWEAVILTGLRPEIIARGKFLAAYTSIALYIVMLAPVGALSFLFGGVTAFEVIVAFAFLFLVAWLSVAFGLTISSKLSSLRAAILLTLLLAVPFSAAAYGLLGPLLSIAIHEVWPAVPEGPPIWLPAAFQRAPFGLEYVIFLIILPCVGIALPAWFLYEATNANLMSHGDDRSYGMKRWFIVASLIMAAAVVCPLFAVDPTGYEVAAIIGMCVLMTFFAFCSFVFQGEPAGPSRRVMARYVREAAGALRRWMGPGLLRASLLQLGLGLGATVMVTVVALVLVSQATFPLASQGEEAISRVTFFGGYAFGFMAFTVGCAAWLRARAKTTGSARVLLFATLAGVAILPWVIAAIAGAMSPSGDDRLLLASPSPFYAFRMMAAVGRSADSSVLVAGTIASVGWLIVGGALLLVADRKCKATIAEHRAILVQADERLAEEADAEREQREQLRAEAEEAQAAAMAAAQQAPPPESVPMSAPVPWPSPETMAFGAPTNAAPTPHGATPPNTDSPAEVGPPAEPTGPSEPTGPTGPTGPSGGDPPEK